MPKAVDVPGAGSFPETGIHAQRIDGAPPPPLFEGEGPSPAAVDRRRREYAFGRDCARQAMRLLGHHPTAVPSGADRRPMFPPKLVGSISHSGALAVAVVGWASRYRSLGVDVEPDPPLDPELAEVIATDAERGRTDLGLLFSAKEAAFKCWYGAGGGRIAEFHEFELDVRPDQTFVVRRQPAPQAHLTGRWARAHGHWWTFCLCERAPR